MRFLPRRLAGLLLAGLLAAVPLAALPRPAAAQLFDVAAMSRAEHPKIVRQFGGEVKDPALREYVASLGNSLVRHTELAGQRFTFTVLSSDIVNAFALPGGYVYVTRGLLALADSEAELAGVLAHEIGHVTGRHGESRMTRTILAQLGLGVLGSVVDSQLLNNLFQVGALAVLQGYSRDQEFDADTRAVRYMRTAGYDSFAMARFLAKLKAERDLAARIAGKPDGGSDQFNFLATHPRTTERVKRAIQQAGGAAPPGTRPRVGVADYMRVIEGMYYGGDPENGFIKDRRFVHPALGFSFRVPPGFSLINNADSVIASGPGNAQIVFDFDKRPRGTSLQRYVRDGWGQKLQLRSLEPITVNGLEGATGTARMQTNQGDRDVRLVAIAHDRAQIARFLFATPPRVTGQLATELQRTTYSYRRLDPETARREQPFVVRTTQVNPGETVAIFADRMPYGKFREERFRVLNGLGPDEKLQPRWWVKSISE